ncbi:NVEALA domain-containing protein [uncultured Parabacteroides sp.]|jgi:hypothetical protein|uniref:NVEALA domain-containing protein n=1 Tax=uncultured Parabacteroides sp. TaxID=512312 RepID=UPI0025F8FCDA|nr:NVEALA domain-containing protein [uncultured Parabacteroides sp.]
MKKLFGIIIIAAIAVTAGWNFSQSQNEVELSDLALANVEALARREVGFNCFWEDRNYVLCYNGFGLGCPCGL